MDSEEMLLKAALSAWKIGVERAGNAFSGLSEQQLMSEIAPGKNRPIYLWGHLTAVHDRMLPLLGLGDRLHPEFDDLFLSQPDKTAQRLPSGDELKRAWDGVNNRLQESFDSLSPSDWLAKHNAVSEEDFAKDPQRNRFSVLLSRTNHLSYHLGQAGLISE